MAAVGDRTGDTAATLGERILRAVETAPVHADGRLPTERRLAVDLGVSRTTIRHGLSQLEAAGVISRHVGRGTYLRDRGPTRSADGAVASLADVAPADVMAVRSLIEPAAMGLAVLRATGRDLDEMDRSLEGGDRADTHDTFEHWDRSLHRCLVAATHNPLLIALYADVEAARKGKLWGQLKRRNDSAERRTVYRCEHHDIVDAVRARDRDLAVTCMQRHLASVSINLFGRPSRRRPLLGSHRNRAGTIGNMSTVSQGRPPTTVHLVALDAAVVGRRRLRAEAVTFDMIVSHGNAVGVYHFDPEGNRCEVHWQTGLSATQPFVELIELDQDPQVLVAAIRRSVEAYGDGGFTDPAYVAWTTAMGRRPDEDL